MKSHMITLHRLHACEPYQVWAKGQIDFESIWNNCERPDWMIWLLRELKFNNDLVYRKYAVWCARNTDMGNGKILWDYLKDERSKICIETVEKYIIGEVTFEEMQIARRAAYAATATATATAAAYATATAAAYAAYADAAAYAAATADAARKIARLSQANYLRSIVPSSILLELVEKFDSRYQK